MPDNGELRRAFAPLRDAMTRWDRAWEALSRRDYDEFDRITGFVMPSTRDGGAAKNAPPVVE